MGTNINAINNGMISGNQPIETRNTLAKRAQEAAAREDQQKDSVDVSKGPVKYAPPAEPAPFKEESDSFSRMKKAAENLQDKLKNQGVDQTQLNQNSLEVITKKQLDEVMSKMNQAQQEGKQQEIKDLERNYAELKSALSDYQTSFETLNTEAASKSQNTIKSSVALVDTAAEEQALLKEFHETTGVEIKSGYDIEAVRGEAFQKFKSQSLELTQKKNAIENEIKELKKPSETIDKTKAASFIKTKETELSQIKTQLQDVQNRAVRFDAIADKIVFLKAKQDLMTTDRDERLTAASEKATALKTSSVEKTSSSRSPSSKSTSGGQTLNVASASGGRRGGDRLEQVDLRVQDTGEREESLETQDDSVELSAPTQENIATMLGAQSTFLAVQSTTTTLNQQSRKTDNEIKKLIRAIQSGNYEALSTAMIMIDKRATQSILNMGLQTIKAMDYYDKQTAQLSKSVGTITGNDTGSSARLQQANIRMSQYSSGRASITSFLRDTMTAKEEITSATRAFQQKRDQISSIASR
ncbi:MAG: hypothetical protein IPJ69_10140 [Deltaproteobacteria bacterium]|nr:MAG: hypothetical protein IPJ69_10140 [Deltaproteobacteria bacterium]